MFGVTVESSRLWRVCSVKNKNEIFGFEIILILFFDPQSKARQNLFVETLRDVKS